MSTTSGTATDYRDLLDKLDAYLTTTGHAWGKSFSGAGNGDLIEYIGTATSVAETITATATSSTNFTVTGSVSGALGAATVGSTFSSSVISFKIVAGSTPFVAGDVFAVSLSPKWTRQRAAGCPDTTKRSTSLTNLENAFDGDQNTWAERAATTCFVEFEMQRASEVRQVRLQIRDTDRAPNGFNIQYRDNSGDAWVTAQTWSGQTWANTWESREFTLTTPPGAHKFWRVNVTGSTGTTLRITQLELLEKAGDAYNLAEHFEILWKAPGLDGAKTIQVGAGTYGRQDSDTFNIDFTAWRQTDASKSVRAQPNGSGSRVLSLVHSPIGYWFIVNGQRAIVVTKFASLYQFAYIGFGLPYETPSVHPFPCVVAASSGSLTLRYNSNSPDFRFPLDPGQVGLVAFYPDGQWRSHVNRYTSASDPEGSYAGQFPGKVWPSDMSFGTDARPSQIRENLDGSRPLLPAILFHMTSPAHVWGELDGVYWTTGFGTVAEAVIREAGFDHLVVNNIFRNGVQHYAALRMD